MKVAIITPFCGESLAVLERCHRSVASQSYPTDHILVSDGGLVEPPTTWASSCIRLPRAHRDGGNTPRAIGAISALNQGYDAIGFLDADNWCRKDHVESCVAAVTRDNAAVVFTDRQIVLSTGRACPFEDRDVARREHVDTSCFFFTREVQRLWPLWGSLDPALWPACDRLMFSIVRASGARVGWTGQRTVYYTSRWGLHFKALGLAPPEDEHVIDWSTVADAFDSEKLLARLGFEIDARQVFSHLHNETSEQGARAKSDLFSRLTPHRDLPGETWAAPGFSAPPQRVAAKAQPHTTQASPLQIGERR